MMFPQIMDLISQGTVKYIEASLANETTDVSDYKATVADYIEYKIGVPILVKFNSHNDKRTSTLDINGLGAKMISIATSNVGYVEDAPASAISARLINGGSIHLLVYDGNRFKILSPLDGLSYPQLVGRLVGYRPYIVENQNTITSADHILRAISKLDRRAPLFNVAAGTNAYTATFNSTYEKYTKGDIINILFTNSNTLSGSSITLNINGLGAKSIINSNYFQYLNVGDIKASSIHTLIYDGTYFQTKISSTIKSYQQGSTGLILSNPFIDINISPVDINKSIVIASGYVLGSGSECPIFCNIKLDTTNSFRIFASKAGVSNQFIVRWGVIEFY